MALRALSIAKENFMIALNEEKTVAFNLIDEIETSELTADVDVDINKAMATRYDVLALKEKKDLDQLYFDITDKVTSENTAVYKKANSALIDTKYMYTNGVKLIKLGLRATYIDLLNAGDTLMLSELELDITNREYNADKIKYEIGVITNMELTDSLNKKLISEVEFQKSKLDYKLAKEKYDYEIKTGI
jgi:hypothetical protein